MYDENSILRKQIKSVTFVTFRAEWIQFKVEMKGHSLAIGKNYLRDKSHNNEIKNIECVATQPKETKDNFVDKKSYVLLSLYNNRTFWAEKTFRIFESKIEINLISLIKTNS